MHKKKVKKLVEGKARGEKEALKSFKMCVITFNSRGATRRKLRGKKGEGIERGWGSATRGSNILLPVHSPSPFVHMPS